jgi:hypothetical protein
LIGAIETKLKTMKYPEQEPIAFLVADFQGRRLRSRWPKSMDCRELLFTIDAAHRYFEDKRRSLNELTHWAAHPDDNAMTASILFASLADFPPDDPPSLEDLGAAIREFSVDGFPRNLKGIVGASSHEFLDQLIQCVIRSVIESKVERPERMTAEDWFYDFYFKTFAACWEQYKPLFRELKKSLDFDELRAQLMAEHVRAQIRLSQRST